ncbi:NACHT domain-containing protein [Phormidesmis sp. 146-35]
MSKLIFDWKRFWCPRTAQISLSDRGGYLVDPDSEYGKKYFNPDLVSFEAIADIPCLVLLGEPGIGKSQEMKNLIKHTQGKLNLSHSPLELNLRSCSSLAIDLIPDQDFIDWINGEHRLYLFLDSLDEGLLDTQNLATQLVDEFRKRKYRDKLNRLYLRIVCRTAVFPQVLEEGLKELWKDGLAIYELAPLRYADVETAATIEGIEPQSFLSEVWDKKLVPLAIKPVTLRFLLNIYKHQDGHFSSDQTLCSLYLKGCRLLGEEVNPSRQGRTIRNGLESDQRLIVAARIAAVTVFANRFAVWTGIDQGEVPAEDVLIRQIILGNEVSNHKEVEVTEAAIREVLDSGLFSSRGSNRMGWAHQTYAEFLAAWYLEQHKLPLTQVKQLIFSAEDPEHKLIPQLHETAAWLASMRGDVLEEIIKSDPDVLLRSDVPTDADVRSSIVNNLLAQYEQERLFDRSKDNYHQYSKLSHPGLPAQLHPYICNSGKQIDARSLSIDIAEVCEVSELQEELVNLALDSSQSIYLRVSAARSICSVGDVDTRLKLMPLAIGQFPEDEDDQLKGYALRALWSDHLTAEKLLNALTSPKKKNFFGSYHRFIDSELASKLQPDDLVVALSWLEKQSVRCFGHPFEHLGNAILVEAWKHLEDQPLSKIFAKIAFVQWEQHERLITADLEQQQKFELALLNEDSKRRKLLKEILNLVTDSDNDLSFLLGSSTEQMLFEKDTFWMLNELSNSPHEKEQKKWSCLIRWTFNQKNAQVVDLIIKAACENKILRKEFDFYLGEIEYLEYQKWNNRERKKRSLEPSPRERVALFLGQLENGDLLVWWLLNREMTLKPDSEYYGDDSELDLTKLPGWQEAEEATQKRIIEIAKKYVQQQNDIAYEWIGTNSYNRPAIAGCRALQLLLKESPDFLATLLPEIWKKWAPIIIAAPNTNQNDDSYLEIVKYAYLKAPQESINTLIKLIDKENQTYGCIFAITRFDKCWDQRLKLTLLEKAKDSSLKPKCIEQLLEKLLEQGLAEARDFTKSLISLPLPLEENEREKALGASRVLVKDSDPSSWLFIWSLIQQDLSFGRIVLESDAYRYSDGIQSNLTETQLADLYLWLVHQYPYGEDSDYSNDIGAHDVTVRDCMARLRDITLSQLKERGTLQACDEIQRLIQKLPSLVWLKKTFLNAQKNMRRRTWKPPTPEEVFQLVLAQEPSNSDLSNKLDTIDRRTQKMKDDPKIDKSIHISKSKNIRGINTGDNNRPDDKTGFDWKFWLSITVAVIVALISVAASGVFNDEIKNLLFNRNPSPPQVEQKLKKQTN